MVRNGDISFWWQDIGLEPQRPPLDGDIDVDVCIVGAGYTGLWTAYALQQAAPDVRIALVEARFAGFGASGRNGGWVSGAVTGGRARYERSHSRQAAIDQQIAHNGAVDRVMATISDEQLDADAHHGGELRVAYKPAHLARLEAEFDAESQWPATDLVRLTAAEARERLNVADISGALWDPHCARVHPAKLARGLARLVTSRGARIYESTRVSEIRPGMAITDRGTVRASHVIRATEGFTPDLPGHHRTWLPMNSSMIVTDPIPGALWSQIGWEGRETVGDYAHVYMYAQRTADNRIAFGGRGVPYRFGSRVDTDGRTQERTIASLTALLHRFFPALSEVPISHGWAGVLGVPRDWAAGVTYSRATGLGTAGGYVGTGVASANLAGRTLADLILGVDSDLTRLPWVGHSARKWEVEPLRWLAVHSIYTAYRWADRMEDRGRSAVPLPARIADVIAGR